MGMKTPNPIDKHVGSRVRMRRMMLGMSQEKLADGLDLTFQQVQKYEKGTNRIGAGRLQQFPISFRSLCRSFSRARHMCLDSPRVRATPLLPPMYPTSLPRPTDWR